MLAFNAANHAFPLGERTYIMGILNVTPDSFSDGGRYLDPERAVERALEMEREGADILDIGAQSTRPGYTPVSPKMEWMRLAPVLERLAGKTKLPISIDTFYPEVAREALAAGAHIINDVEGMKNRDMLAVLRENDCGYIVMHAESDGYPFGVAESVRRYLAQRVLLALEAGIDRQRICIDPGIGFGKSHEENLELLRDLREVHIMGCALLIGASRKRVVRDACGNPPVEDRLYGTLAAHSIAIFNGADIVRVHDVPQAKQAALMADAIRGRNAHG